MNQKFLISVITALIIFYPSLNHHSLHPETKPDEEVVFYPTYAFQNIDGTITCKVHGHIFEKEEDSVLRKRIIHLIMEGAEEDESRSELNPYLKGRIIPFLYDNEGGKTVTLKINGLKFTPDESGDNGHFHLEISLPFKKMKTGIMINFQTIKSSGLDRSFSGNSIFISCNGISVISDIDDTIKDSNVHDKKELLKNTFLREFKAVKGISEFYRKLESKGAAFHYVSGSPWQLYPSISEFLDKEKFPAGSVHLKYIRAKDSSIIDFITADQLAFKVGNIESIIKDFPQRKFILIGDSGEYDPEVYTEIASRYRDNVTAVFIRDVNKAGEKPERYAQLKAMEPGIIFRLYRDTAELKTVDLKNR